MSEFSGAWGKRGEGGQGREGVQLPDSLMYEAVLQSAGPGLKTPQSPPWWQQTEEAVCRVGGITCNAEGFAGETGAVNVLEGGERDTNDLLSCSHYALKWLALQDALQDALQAPYHTVMQLVRMLSMVPL